MSTKGLNEKSEKIKNNIKTTAETSKETIREIIESNSKYIDSALDTNKKIVESIKAKLNQQEIDDSITDTFKYTFKKSVELAEDAIDSIIQSYTKQAELNIDFNTKLIDVLKDSGDTSPEKVLNLIQENFEKARQLNINSTKELLDFYNKHTNLAINFNKKFGETINTQVELLTKIQNKGLASVTGWASNWWKENEKEVKYS